MKLLLDTHVLLWWLKDPDELRAEARQRIRSSKNTVYYSAVNIWEIVIKSALGKLPPLDQGFVETALSEDAILPLPVSPDHAWAVMQLPPHHADPFDRLLIAQAQHESLRLVTRDGQFKSYRIDLIEG